MYKNSLFFIIAVILILAVVFIPTISFDSMLKNDVKMLNEKIDDILKTDFDDSSINEKCDSFEELWNKHMKHWSFVVHHNAIEKIELAVCSFIEYTKAGDRQGAVLEAERLYKLFEMTSKQDELSLLNIL